MTVNEMYSEKASMNNLPERCRAKDPATCRYHGYANEHGGGHSTDTQGLMDYAEKRNEAQYGKNFSTSIANGSRETVKMGSIRENTTKAPEHVSAAVKGAVKAKNSIKNGNKPVRQEKKSVSELSKKFNVSSNPILNADVINKVRTHHPDIHTQSYR